MDSGRGGPWVRGGRKHRRAPSARDDGRAFGDAEPACIVVPVAEPPRKDCGFARSSCSGGGGGGSRNSG